MFTLSNYGKIIHYLEFFVLFLLRQALQNGALLIVDMDTDRSSGFDFIMLFQSPADGIVLLNEGLVSPLILEILHAVTIHLLA